MVSDDIRERPRCIDRAWRAKARSSFGYGVGARDNFCGIAPPRGSGAKYICRRIDDGLLSPSLFALFPLALFSLLSSET